MGGSHSHGDEARPTTSRALRFAMTVIVPTAVLSAIGMVLLWPDEVPEPTSPTAEEVTGEVVGVSERECPEPEAQADPRLIEEGRPCGVAAVKLDDGGEHVVVALPTASGTPEVGHGDSVVLIYLAEAEPHKYHVVDHDRTSPLWILAATFALAVIAFGRWQGLRSLGGLVITFAILLLFVVPAVLSGQPPLLTAIVGAGAIMLTVLYVTHGFRPTTTVAVAGTLASLVLTGVLSALAVGFTHLTGVADEETNMLSLSHNVNMEGLLLAGIIIGALGALDDVTSTQANAVAELARANPGYGTWQLYQSAARIGRAHIGSVVNTLILAYAGASLPLMILIAAADRPLGQVLTTQLMAEEIVRSVVGTLGLIAAVPITTWLAALAARQLNEPGADAAFPSGQDLPDDPDGAEAPAVHATDPGPRPKAARNEWMDMHDDADPPRS